MRIIDLRTGNESRPVAFYAEEKDSRGRIVRKVRRGGPPFLSESPAEQAERYTRYLFAFAFVAIVISAIL